MLLKIMFLAISVAPIARAADLVVKLPDNLAAREAIVAIDNQPTQIARGQCAGQSVLFSNLISGKAYDASITLRDGVILRGVNMGWYTREPARPDAGPLDEDDRKQVTSQVGAVKSFYDTSRVLLIAGDHDRATTLVEEIRSSKFHSDAGDEVIWRVELWYWVNEFGGWSQPPQTSKVLERQRFTSEAEFKATTQPLRWTAELGGITLKDQELRRELDLPKGVEKLPMTRPAN